MSRTTPYSKSNPCPVCSFGTKGCSVTADGLQLCRGTPGPEWKLLKETGHAGFCCYRHEDDDSRFQRSHDRRVLGLAPLKADKPAKPPFDWGRFARQFVPQLGQARKDELSRRLGVPASVFDLVPLLGYCRQPLYLLDGQPIDESHWTCPETDAAGRVIGIERRYRKEHIAPGETDKKAVSRCNRGLILPTGWESRPGPALNVEGFSCTVAATAAGLCATSRPSADSGIEHLVELYRDWPIERDIIIVGEYEASGAGVRGAEKLATQLAERLNRPVKWSLPPAGFKDAREYLRDGGGWNETP